MGNFMNDNTKPLGERRSGKDRRDNESPRRKVLRNEPGKPPRRSSLERRKNSIKNI